MSLVQNPIDALYNGVSQQPANMRLPSQCEALVNGYPTVADGLQKRPPSQHVAKITASTFTDPYIHIINRDSDNQFAIIVTDGAYAVYDLSDGSSQTVSYEAAATYLDLPVGAKPSESFEVVTVADYSFIVNKTKTVATVTMPTSEPVGYSRWYFPNNWKTADDGTRYYTPTFGTDRGSVQTLQDLPAPGDLSPPVENDVYRIKGDDEGGFTEYHVIYKGGVWVETHAYNGAVALDETTMPHAIVNETGTFTFREFPWVPRLFGDENTNPDPSFVGKQISSLGYYKNRLVMAAGENIIFSGAGDFGNFYRTTVTQVVPSDVVDVAVSTKQVSKINHVLPADTQLMFFSDQKQFVLNVDEILTPSTVSVDVATSYQMDPLIRPINVGPDVYFATKTGNFSRVREYTMSPDESSVEVDATDITAQVAKYLPSDGLQLAGSSNEDVLFFLSRKSGFENRLYVYKYFYSNNEKVQSAWCYWEWEADSKIKGIDILNNILYLIIERSDGTYLEKLDVQQTVFPAALDFDIYLDHRWTVSGSSYDGSTWTTITLPYDVLVADRPLLRLVQTDGDTPGRVVDPTSYDWVSATQVRIPGDWTAIGLLAGYNYTQTFEFSQQFQRDGNGRAITTGRYQLRSITVVYEDMATFNTHVDPYGNGNGLTEDIVTAGMSDFTAKTIGADTAVLGEPTFEDGTYMFQIYGNSEDAVVRLTNDQPFGGKFVSATVEGFFTNRGRS